MAIRPLDMQVMIPKLQEVAHMKQIEQQKAGIHQQQIGTTIDKKNEKSQKSVEKSSEDDVARNQADAKEAGKNKYYSNKKKKNVEKKMDENTATGLPRNKIDIKI